MKKSWAHETLLKRVEKKERLNPNHGLQLLQHHPGVEKERERERGRETGRRGGAGSWAM